MGRDTKITERFGARVRELRANAALSQEAFADKFGLDRTYVSGILRGKSLQPFLRVCKLNP
jgi:transcriptional regulator with XRE-family HTH domain